MRRWRRWSESTFQNDLETRKDDLPERRAIQERKLHLFSNFSFENWLLVFAEIRAAMASHQEMACNPRRTNHLGCDPKCYLSVVLDTREWVPTSVPTFSESTRNGTRRSDTLKFAC